MRLTFMTMAPFVFLCATASAEHAHQYMPRAILKRHSGFVTVIANNPRPLWQAIVAVREEYGWLVDYEDPMWTSRIDLRDASPGWWHSEHPGKTGFLVPAGGAFHCTYQESPDMWNSTGAEEKDVLERIVSDYNESGNPGRFIVRRQADGSYAVIGVESEDKSGAEISRAPIFNTHISLEKKQRSAQDTLTLILRALSEKSGKVVGLAGLPRFNSLHQSTVDIGGRNLLGRDLLTQLFEEMGVKMVWDLWYEPNLHDFGLIFHPAVLATPSVLGGRRLVPISPVPSPGGSK